MSQPALNALRGRVWAADAVDVGFLKFSNPCNTKQKDLYEWVLSIMSDDPSSDVTLVYDSGIEKAPFLSNLNKSPEDWRPTHFLTVQLLI